MSTEICTWILYAVSNTPGPVTGHLLKVWNLNKLKLQALAPTIKPVDELRFGWPDDGNTWYVWFANLGLIILILAMLALRNDLLDRSSPAPEENTEMENQNSTQETPIQLNTTLRIYQTTSEPVLFPLTINKAFFRKSKLILFANF